MSTPMNDKAREAFEAYITEDGKWPDAAKKGPSGQYMLAYAASAWTTWQAALQWAASQQAAPDGWRLVPVEPAIGDNYVAGLWSRRNWVAALADQPAAPAQQAAEGWRPISEAPKEGRDMILLLAPSRFPQVAFSNTWWTSGFSVECKPTYWMPIPAAPTAQGERDEQ